MDNLLTEFEDLDVKKSNLTKWVTILFSITILYFLSFIFFPSGFENISWSHFTSADTYIMLGIITIPGFFLYLFYKRNNIGWLLISVVTWLLLGLYCKILYLFFSGTWPLSSIQRGLITIYFSLHYAAILLLLYAEKVRKDFKIETTFLTASLFIGILVFLVGLISMG